MQFDVGAPHGFLDFRFRLNDDGSGEFWLPYCGALMDVEPMGEQFVVGMCHHIEDPTFDATAVASNPRARVRPIHRPPRVPADREPHCHWRVRIDPGAEPLEEIAAHPARPAVAPGAARDPDARRRRHAAPIRAASPTTPGPSIPTCTSRTSPAPPSLRIAQEFCLQGHLLVRAFMMEITDRWGEDVAREIAAQQFIGAAGLAAERVAAAMQIRGDPAPPNRRDDDPGADLDAIAKLFQLHPAFHPRAYLGLHVERERDRRALLDRRRRGARRATIPTRGSRCWMPEREPHPALDAIVRTVNPRARCRALEVPGARVAWRVEIDPDSEPAPEPPAVGLAKLSKGATFRFVPRRAPTA